MNDTQIETDETHDLIASDKVEGTAVYNGDGEKLGAIHNFMVDKRSGQVEYAVVPPAPGGPAVQYLSADGAMVPLVGGDWAEVKTLALGEVQVQRGADVRLVHGRGCFPGHIGQLVRRRRDSGVEHHGVHSLGSGVLRG